MASPTRVACLALPIALALAVFAPAPAPAAGCTRIGDSVLCDGRLSTNQVGRRVIFPQGPAGARVGSDFVVPEDGGLPQVLDRPKPAPGRRTLNRADRISDPRRGEDFGAFQFPSGPLKLRDNPFQ